MKIVEWKIFHSLLPPQIYYEMRINYILLLVTVHNIRDEFINCGKFLMLNQFPYIEVHAFLFTHFKCCPSFDHYLEN